MNSFTQGLLATLIVCALGACSSTPTSTTVATNPQSENKSATHYWYSDSKTTQREYKTDNASCQQQTETDASGALDPDSTSFAAYKDCMIKQGYSLRTYFF